MLLIVAKSPDVHNSVKNVMNGMKNSGFGDEMKLIGMSAVRRMKTAPMSRSEAFEEISPTKARLTLAENLISMRK